MQTFVSTNFIQIVFLKFIFLHKNCLKRFSLFFIPMKNLQKKTGSVTLINTIKNPATSQYITQL